MLLRSSALGAIVRAWLLVFEVAIFILNPDLKGAGFEVGFSFAISVELLAEYPYSRS